PIAPKSARVKTPKELANECRKDISGRPLKVESRLITHRSTVEHVAWGCCGPLSVGALTEIPAQRKTEITGRDRLGQSPVVSIIKRSRVEHRHRLTRNGGEIRRLRSLVNLERNDTCANEERGRRHGIGCE